MPAHHGASQKTARPCTVARVVTNRMKRSDQAIFLRRRSASLPAPDYTVGVIAGNRGNHMSDKWLATPNDRVVSVESARLDGMTDFIEVNVTHWDMRRDPVVADLVIVFLRHGKFNYESAAQ
jgi:hypothetical protein